MIFGLCKNKSLANTTHFRSWLHTTSCGFQRV